jgi:bifunctional non-homologous end joining protein LigD
MPRESKLPKQLQPMLATLIDAPFDSPDWVFETKWDGFRLVARIEKRSVTLY